VEIGTTRPYPPTGLTSASWREVPIRYVYFVELTTTQDGVYLRALLAIADPASGDPYPHVVAYQGILYLEDGHTRVARDILRGCAGAYMRICEK
jgi:hypothetical protein